jgi:hypothetical protein
MGHARARQATTAEVVDAARRLCVASSCLGSPAAGTADAASDIDLIIRVHPGRFRAAWQARSSLHVTGAFYTIAPCRMRYDQRTRAYVVRRTAQGLNSNETIRCLKRYIVREVYAALRGGFAALAT